VHMDAWDPEAQPALRAAATTMSHLTFYAGQVQHGYALQSLTTPERCPRCQARTRQHYAHFVYATQDAPRVMMAPAGYFCTQCPTVVIDEAMIRAGITGPFTFHGVLGIESEARPAPDFFRTWNGQEAVYLFDEDQRPQGLATMPPASSPRRLTSRHRRHGRQRMVKASRKHNQRKR